VTAKYQPVRLQRQQQAITGNLAFLGGATATSLRPPRFLARASFSAPVTFDKGTLSANLIYSKTYEGVQSKIATLSYSRPLPYSGSLFLTAFADFGTNKNRGFYAGLSFPLGYGISGSASVSRSSYGKMVASLEASKPQPMTDNTYGWRVRASREHNHVQQAAGSYRSSYGQIGGQVTRDGERLHGTATFDGSVAVMGGGVFIGNRVNSSFAVVSVGKPNVPIKQDHRVIGKTNMFGKMLVPNLRSFERNTIAIDPSSLPASFDATNLSMAVSPYRHSGVVVDFSPNASSQAAIVVFKGADGKFLMTGSQGKTASGQKFIIGYDGQAYIRGLSASNSVTIDLGSRDCKAQFDYARQGDKQVLIDNVVCN
jgi:outer membrane usher protein